MRADVLGLGLALALALAGGCRQKQIPVVEEASADDFGLAAVTQAAAELSKTPTSPAAYRTFALKIDELRPRFNQRVADHAELELAFLALGPLAAILAEPPEAQLAALATTVWPTALVTAPTAGEAPATYLARLCGGPLAGECKYVVPEAWPVVMAAKVWRRMKLRAREAYANCSACQRDPSYQRTLEDYDRHDTAWQARLKLLGDRIEPAFWPRAGGHAAPWVDAPLLELATDTVTLAGEPLPDEGWRKELAARRDGDAVLGVHLRPRQEVRILRAALRDAAAAGWTQVELQVREATYPFPLRSYRLEARPHGTRLSVRDVDTIQVLIQALDVAAGRLAARDPARPAVLSI